jgi:hypothetical protein
VDPFLDSLKAVVPPVALDLPLAGMMVMESPDANGSGDFTTTSRSSGFVVTAFGTAQGSAAGGATGSQIGFAEDVYGIGTITFDGLTEASGAGTFGAGVSPVQFNTVTTTIPGVYALSGGSKKGGTNMISLPITVTNIVPVSTGPTGGFGTGNGVIDIISSSTGTLMHAMVAAMPMGAAGRGSSTGEATNLGGGSGTATNFFGSAGGLGSGAGTGAATAGGFTIAFSDMTGTFTGAGSSNGNFNNVGFGLFGGNGGSLTFP